MLQLQHGGLEIESTFTSQWNLTCSSSRQCLSEAVSGTGVAGKGGITAPAAKSSSTLCSFSVRSRSRRLGKRDLA